MSKNQTINHEAIAREIADALTDMSEFVVGHLADTYDDECGHVLEYRDGVVVPFCPMTRKQCMGRACAAAVREDCCKLATATTGRVAEWRCAEYACVVDCDEAEQPTPEEVEEVREDTIANIAECFEGRDVDVARVYYDLTSIYFGSNEDNVRGKLFRLIKEIKRGDYDRASDSAE